MAELGPERLVKNITLTMDFNRPIIIVSEYNFNFIKMKNKIEIKTEIFSRISSRRLTIILNLWNMIKKIDLLIRN